MVMYSYRDFVAAFHLGSVPEYRHGCPPPIPAPVDEIYLVIDRSPEDDNVVKVLTSAGVGWVHVSFLSVVE